MMKTHDFPRRAVPARFPRPRAAFTLVELLVVMGLVALLAALLSTAVSSARAKSLTVKCVGQLRTLALAHQSYRMEHNGKGPPNVASGALSASEGGHTVSGIELLRPYYRTPNQGRYVWTVGHTYMKEEAEHCPSHVIPGDDYGYMMTVLFQDGVAGARSFLSFFTEPAMTPVLWDGYRQTSANMRQKIPLRHQGGINMAFLDGHVEYVDGKDKRLYNDYFYTLFQNGTPNPAMLGKGPALGATSLP